MLKRRSFWIIAVLLLALAAVGARAVVKSRQAASAASAASVKAANAVPVLEFLPSDLVTVTPRDLRQTLAASGSLRAYNQAAVKARVAGEVREVLVREGEAVKAGQVLVRMDEADYRARAAQAEGALVAARGQLDIAAKARENNRALLDRGFISKNAYDTASSQYDIAQANVNAAQGGLDVSRKALGDTVIRAPISGIVASRSVQPGEKVSADNKLLDVVDLARMEMEVAVPTSEIIGISPGQEVSVKVEGLPQQMPATVVRINPATQAGSRSIMTYLQLDNPQNRLRAGMFGEARLTLAKKPGVLAVPPSSLQRNGDSAYVYAIEQDKLVRRQVQTGITGSDGDATLVEITAGLEPGARIVRSNLGNLPVGAAVKVLQPSGASALDASAR
ncbi:efflux RND transporter periplasmic adaptor subunit [Noviherbaspirillum suwonense]|uniref:RND family efflux transporter, MFP subunit n=1 Tax=Noviherbaspirillum suwonense TaxID=1224511 RepID=A0ABY1Q5T7_9BURK|nr:efflux RND transporter periplasmic adaptor subunit [Noviherbaspirillum suwonense]SMP59912.1 RND family efflux transporter, MFP subunit [Noviherbaspirillum suwonense]